MNGSILLVEDDPDVRDVTESVLASAGYRVQCAGNAEEALRLLFNGKAVDLLLTDVMMPGMDGVALANEAKRLRPALGVLYVSGFRDPERLRGDQKHGAVIAKPYRAEQLLAAVKDTLTARK